MDVRLPAAPMIHTESQRQKLEVAHAAVRTIGLGLDHQVFPKVANGGRVLPNTTASLPVDSRKENCHEREETGSAAGSRKGAAGRKRTAGGSRPSGAAAPVVRRSAAADYDQVLTELAAAYPGSQVRVEEDGIWLIARSALVEGLDREAVFAVAIPFDLTARAQGWGFWSRGCLAFAQWIGPRHTNFPFGSICAFDERDDVWHTGDSPILLLDLYSVWAVRHLHLELFGRWPGAQSARWPFERLLECREDELCGCGALDKTYSDCCLSTDLQRDTLRDAISFLSDTFGGHREPPREVVGFLNSQSDPPPMRKYF